MILAACIILLVAMALLAVVMVRMNNVLYLALGVLAQLVGVAAIFALWGAEFLAAAQLVVYAGGIMVLLAFGLMISNLDPVQLKPISGHYHRFVTGLICFSLFGLLAWGIVQADFNKAPHLQTAGTTSVHPNLRLEQLGALLLTDGLFPLELVGVLLTVVLVGATRLASRK